MRLSACLALAATFLLASPALAQKDKSVSFIDRFDQSDATMVVEAFTDAMAAATKPQDLIFHMVQLPNEEWRLDRISWKGSLEQMRPWGVPL